MSAEFTAFMSGTLERTTGLSDTFSCSLDTLVPEVRIAEHADNVSTPIIGGVVDWPWLGAPKGRYFGTSQKAIDGR